MPSNRSGSGSPRHRSMAPTDCRPFRSATPPPRDAPAPCTSSTMTGHHASLWNQPSPTQIRRLPTRGPSSDPLPIFGSRCSGPDPRQRQRRSTTHWCPRASILRRRALRGAGTDFTDLTNGTVEFPATPTSPTLGGDTGPRLSWIKIRLYRDRVGEHPETFDVNLVGHNNTGGAVSTRVTILDSDGGPDPDPDPDPEMHPKGKLHHPRHHYKYPRNYPYLNEIHLFTQNAKGLQLSTGRQCPGPDETANGRFSSQSWRFASASRAACVPGGQVVTGRSAVVRVSDGFG